MKAELANKRGVDPSTVRVPGRAPRWVIPAVKSTMVVADILIAALAFAGAFYLRESQELWEFGR